MIDEQWFRLREKNMKSIKKELQKALKKLSSLLHVNSDKLVKLSNEEWASAAGQRLVRETNYLAQSEIFLRDTISCLNIAEKTRSLNVGGCADE